MLKGTILILVMMAMGGTALAQESPRNAVMAAQRVGPARPGKVVSKSRQPVGTPHKASSFAPHKASSFAPHNTRKRVFGDPIQAPIVHSQGAPKRQ
jgi:hypothetical protein